MCRSCAHVGGDTAEDERIRIRRIFEREKQSDHIRAICECTVQVSEPRVLVSGILCRHSGKEHEENRRVYPEPTERRSDSATVGNGV